jgi:hypothetical protein
MVESSPPAEPDGAGADLVGAAFVGAAFVGAAFVGAAFAVAAAFVGAVASVPVGVFAAVAPLASVTPEHATASTTSAANIARRACRYERNMDSLLSPATGRAGGS